MIILDVLQGSSEWIEIRGSYLCASEAPAMMGCSKFMSRNDLLNQKKGWKSNPVSSFQESLYEKGHEYEDMARTMIETDYCDDFPPKVAVNAVHGVAISLLASFDGLSETIAWEHKSWNKTLAENVRNGVLEPMYCWQLEHQMLVAGHDKIIFTCSDGTMDNCLTMVYESIPERRQKLIAGWNQFLIDLENHVIEAKQEKVIASTTMNLPEVTFDVQGKEINTNINECLVFVRDLSKKEMSRSLETEQDFANKKEFNKNIKNARKKLKEAVNEVRGNFVSFAEFQSVAQEIDSIMQKMQSHGEKLVKEKEEEKKQKLIGVATEDMSRHINSINEKIAPMQITDVYGYDNPDFIGAMKNKRTLETIASSLNVELAAWKIRINSLADRVILNMEYANRNFKEHMFLFSDMTQLAGMGHESFKAIAGDRIDDHKKFEADKLDADNDIKERGKENSATEGINDKTSRFIYALTKEAAIHGFDRFLEKYGFNTNDYKEIKACLNKRLGGIETYV